MKKFLSLFLAFILLFSFSAVAGAEELADIKDDLIAEFLYGEGPEADGNSIDYRYYTPVGEEDTAKYPLVIWLHGMGDGTKEGAQVSKSNISYWASDEFQARFANGGAFILAARSKEEQGHTWDNSMLEPLKAAIDDFIAKNAKNIDLSRIYVGGYSMGGKMTLKMAIAFPEMFAAAFPICPAWSPSEELLAKAADIPMWLVSGKTDPLVNYYFSVSKTWSKITATNENPEECRFSTLSKVCYEDGKRTTSAHHAWFSVNHDMFSVLDSDYPDMSTVNGNGEEVTLTFPNGMISWLCEHTSDYDGTPTTGKGNLEGVSGTDSIVDISGIIDFFKTIFEAIKDLFKLN